MRLNYSTSRSKTLYFMLVLLASACCERAMSQDTDYSSLKDDYISMFADPKDRGELEITPDQLSEIRKRTLDLTLRHRNAAKDGRPFNYRSERKKVLVEILEVILLPHQRDRFLQLAIRDEISRNMGSLSLFLKGSADPIFKRQGIEPLSKDQKDSLTEISQAANEKLEAASKKYLQSIEKILIEEKRASSKLLTTAQDNLVQELLGDSYGDFSEGEEFAVRILTLYVSRLNRARDKKREK